MKARKSSGIEALHLNRITEPRRRRLSSDSIHAHQVFGFFLDLDIAVADDAEGAAGHHRVAGKQAVEIKPDGVFQRDEARLVVEIGQADEALKLRRHGKQRRHRLAIVAARDADHHDEAEIRNEREGMRGVDGERRKNGENLLAEFAVESDAVFCRELIGLHDHDAGIGHRHAQFGPDLLLLGNKLARHRVDAGELLRRRQPIVGKRRHARIDHAFEASHAHHVKFVEVGRRNGKEAQPLQHRMAQILRLFQHAAVESKPRQFAIDKAQRRGGVYGRDKRGLFGGRRGIGRRHRFIGCDFPQRGRVASGLHDGAKPRGIIWACHGY